MIYITYKFHLLLIKTPHRTDEMNQAGGRQGGFELAGSKAAAVLAAGGRSMRTRRAIEKESAVCSSGLDGRILNYDHSGRSFSVLSFRQPIGVRALGVLSELNVGENAILVALDLPESVQNHLMHMGFVPDALVTALRRAPAGDPTVYSIDGLEIALRHETAESIRIRPAGSEISEESDLDELLEASR